MPKDRRRDKLSWKSKRANHGRKPCRGNRRGKTKKR